VWKFRVKHVAICFGGLEEGFLRWVQLASKGRVDYDGIELVGEKGLEMSLVGEARVHF